VGEDYLGKDLLQTKTGFVSFPVESSWEEMVSSVSPRALLTLSKNRVTTNPVAGSTLHPFTKILSSTSFSLEMVTAFSDSRRLPQCVECSAKISLGIWMWQIWHRMDSLDRSSPSSSSLEDLPEMKEKNEVEPKWKEARQNVYPTQKTQMILVPWSDGSHSIPFPDAKMASSEKRSQQRICNRGD